MTEADQAPVEKVKKKGINPLVLVLLALLVAGGGAYVFLTLNKQPVETATQQAVEFSAKCAPDLSKCNGTLIAYEVDGEEQIYRFGDAATYIDQKLFDKLSKEKFLKVKDAQYLNCTAGIPYEMLSCKKYGLLEPVPAPAAPAAEVAPPVAVPAPAKPN